MGVLAAKKSAVTVALLAAAILAMLAANAEAQATQFTCASKLIPCRNYLNSTNPPEECCKPLKDAVTNELTCLCYIFKNPEILKGLGVDINQAIKLPFYCGITNSSDSLCKSTAADSPSGNPGSPGTPATPGNGSNGANGSKWVGLLGMSGLFLIWWSILA
ncbi:hypothetical protein KFK09_018091 [Dendrobium nobile]|uniref:Bifunctional inhibitor/plant lipid transfer protein/seed storage helical domain-containing protein n=1 Tax=Dendrobium nobile TaxID=94219 RepID=A0A8T3ATV2_DENNO|nr:hypothetical protein KFK09_018091 [Dendrobium nobile]